jgi:formylglycine-generating enzyme required for sulfatase activity
LWNALQAARQPANADELKAAAAWAWCELGRCADLGLVKVPAGEFWMGSDKAKDGDAQSDELPQHRLYLPAFYIAKAPATVAEWRAYCQSSGHEPTNTNSLKGPDNHPVRYVTWHESLAYTRYYGFALPSEAEWEKAARGAEDGRLYPWGDAWQPGRANTAEHWQGRTGNLIQRLFRRDVNEQTTPVGKFSPLGDSPYGCVDMAGNVWEWTRSKFANYPYNPTDGREDLTDTESRRVLRGGSFYNNRVFARLSYRYHLEPGDLWYDDGFRVGVAAASPIAGS